MALTCPLFASGGPYCFVFATASQFLVEYSILLHNLPAIPDDPVILPYFRTICAIAFVVLVVGRHYHRHCAVAPRRRTDDIKPSCCCCRHRCVVGLERRLALVPRRQALTVNELFSGPLRKRVSRKTWSTSVLIARAMTAKSLCLILIARASRVRLMVKLCSGRERFI